jgi:ABC transport system ATP-binding/permease protein
VLDEPTNDLDLETLDLLQEMLVDYPGTVLLVSHDRDFIDRVATSTIMFEREGVWREYPGGYSDMVAQRGAGVDARRVAAPPKTPAAQGKTEPPAKAASKARLSQKDQYALQAIPAKLDALASRARVLQDVLDLPGLYAQDPSRFTATASELAQVQAETAQLEDQWLELELQREAIGN